MKPSIYHGDCLDIMKDIKDNSIDMILCDLPYGTTKAKWDIIIPFEKLWKEYLRVGKENCPFVLFGSEPFTSIMITSNISMFKYRITWDKVSVTGHLNANKMPMMQTEDICVFYKRPPTYNPIFGTKSDELVKKTVAKFTGKEQKNNIYNNASARPIGKNYKKRYPTNLISLNAKAKECNGVNRVHPTQKPVELLENLVKTYTNFGDRVLDNAMGSGSTGEACKNLGREFTGIEKDLKYFGIAKKRINT